MSVYDSILINRRLSLAYFRAVSPLPRKIKRRRKTDKKIFIGKTKNTIILHKISKPGGHRTKGEKLSVLAARPRTLASIKYCSYILLCKIIGVKAKTEHIRPVSQKNSRTGLRRIEKKMALCTNREKLN